MFKKLLVLLLFVFISCSKEHFSTKKGHISEKKDRWWSGEVLGFDFPHHEALTYFAIKIANKELSGRYIYPEPEFEATGEDTNNYIILGNYLTDYPNNRILNFYEAHEGSWHRNPNLQFIHFLRNYYDDVVDDIQNSCMKSREAIFSAADSALSSQFYGDEEDKHFWIGHALHIIQDSFSPGHTKREGEGLKDIVDICTFGRNFPGICYHYPVMKSDSVWSDDCIMSERFECLKEEAKAAVYASVGFLVEMAKHFINDETSVYLKDYYLDKNTKYSGFFNCERL